jgi:hypothetical protein
MFSSVIYNTLEYIYSLQRYVANTYQVQPLKDEWGNAGPLNVHHFHPKGISPTMDIYIEQC